ncbi:hypothetical protein ACHAXA_004564 [Cyclostephanos tholiformis]|uniref:Uncharacterized protein n=1 Tax=Cyclostephanos tholiformis TaxID=382380 RepID=A0ABD3RDH8_9STRA
MTTRQGNYRRVSQNEADRTTSAGMDGDDDVGNLRTIITPSFSSSRRSSSSRSERISNKLHALVWVVSSLSLAKYTRLFATICNDERIYRPSLCVAISLYVANVVLTLYLIVYLPCRFPIPSDDDDIDDIDIDIDEKRRNRRRRRTSASSPEFWRAYCPNVLSTMTIFGIVGSYLLCRACYPVWGFLSPFILGAVGLGFFYGLHFVPAFCIRIDDA